MSLLFNSATAKSSSMAKTPPKSSTAKSQNSQSGVEPKSAMKMGAVSSSKSSKTSKSKTKSPTSQSNNVEPPSSAPDKTTDRLTENRAGNNNNSASYAFTRFDVPNGFLPPGFKDCLLSNVVRAGRRSLEEFKEVRESLSNLVAEDEQLSKGIKKVNPSPEILQLSIVAESLTVLTREAFVPAHRLNQTAIALYSAEDFLRHPEDSRAFEASGRLKIPELSFNSETVEKLRKVVDKASAYYSKFNLKGPNGAELQDIMFTLMRAFQNLFTMFLGCQEVFKVLLYNSSREKVNLQRFLVSLQSMERCDMLAEVQDLRRLADELVIFLEKLSWGCYIVYRLASGKNVPPKFDSEAEGVGEDQEKTIKVKEKGQDIFPGLGFLKKGKSQSRPSTSGKAKKSSSAKKEKPQGIKNNEFEVGKATKKGKKESSKGKKNKGKEAASKSAVLYTATTSKPKSKKTNSKVKFLK